MSDTQKSAGAPCPRCNFHPCSEFRAMHDTRTRWSCNECGAGGQITGSGAAAAAPASAPKKHWNSNKGR